MKKKAWPFETPINPQELSFIPPSAELRGTFSVGETHTPMPEPPVGPIKNSVEEVDILSDIPTESAPPVYIKFHNSDGGILAEFFCDLAKSMQDKVMGLQSYDELSENAGLVFEYDKPQDLVFHMGTVKFPIDIIFIDESDKVKKIYKDIKPGTLGTFGCAGAKNVLEISGGLCDHLGISPGHKASILKDIKESVKKTSNLNKLSNELGIKKKIIVKHANLGPTNLSLWNNYPTLILPTSLEKIASKSSMISNLASSTRPETFRNIFVFDFDGLIEKNPKIKVYKTAQIKDSSPSYVKLGGFGVSILKNEAGDEIIKEAYITDVLSNKTEGSIILSLSKSFSNFLNNSEDSEKMFAQLNKVAQEKNSKILIATRLSNPHQLKDIILAKYNLHYNDNPEVDLLKIHRDSGYNDIIVHARSLYGNKEVRIFSDSSILKRAGTPISTDIKNKASKVIKHLSEANEGIDKSIKNLKQNLSEYNKISSDPEAIKKTKGQYRESIERNKEVLKNILLSIKESHSILKEIKDLSSINKIIESIAQSSKTSAEAVQEIFELIDQIESPDFVNSLTQKTSSFEKLISDLKQSTTGAIDHIGKHILDEVIIS